MIRKDHLVKQFEDFGKAIARILNFRREKEMDLLEKEIRSALQRYTSLEIEAVENMDSDRFRQLAGELDDMRMKILADLLFEKMHYYLLGGEEESALLLRYKCLQLYQLLKARALNDFDMDVYYKLQYLNAG